MKNALGHDPQEFAASHREQIAGLADSPERAAWSRARLYGAKEEDHLALVEAFIARARASGLPPHAWYAESEGYGRNTLMAKALGSPNHQKAIKALAAAGASPWPRRIENGAPVYADPEQIVALALPDSHWPLPQGSQRAALSSALAGLDWIPDDLARVFLARLLARFAKNALSSSPGADGVLGRADKSAKQNAANVIACRQALLGACGARAPELLGSAESMLASAEALSASKSRKAREGFDPERLKKSLTAGQKARLRTLMLVAEERPDDPEALACLLADTGWLAASPQSACLNIKGAASLAGIAVHFANIPLLSELDRLGSNLWLASAQCGEANACLWAAMAIQRARWRQTEARKAEFPKALALCARLLAYGAHLDGAADPTSHAVAKIDEALARKSRMDAGAGETLAELRALIESIALQDLLSGREGASSKGSSARSRSRSL